MHDYRAEVRDFSAKLVADSTILVGQIGDVLQPFYSVELNMPVINILSGDEKLDDNMYDALKVDEYPTISFRMEEAGIMSTIGDDSVKITITGALTVAGIEKTIEMPVLVTLRSDGMVGISGTKQLLMTDFDIEPPSLMFGLLETDDKVTIHFELFLRP